MENKRNLFNVAAATPPSRIRYPVRSESFERLSLAARKTWTLLRASRSCLRFEAVRLPSKYSLHALSPNIRLAAVLSNGGLLNYQGLQVQYKMRMSRGLQMLASHAWAHAIDNASDNFSSTLGRLPLIQLSGEFEL